MGASKVSKLIVDLEGVGFGPTLILPSVQGNVHISSTLAVAREEVVDLRGGIWLGLCSASFLIINFSHPPLY